MVALLLTPAPVLAGGVGLLPAEGDFALAGRLDRELPPALTAAGLSGVVGAADLQAQLRRQLQLDGPLARADKLLQQASDQLLRMKRGEAVRLAREAVALLEGIDARQLARPALARAQGLLARGLLLKPADEAGAREAFRAALWADPRHQPDPDQSPPRVLALWREARDTLPPSRPPSIETLGRLAARAAVDHLVWLAVRAGPELEVVVFRARDQAIRSRRQRTTGADLVAEAARLATRGVKGPRKVPASGPASREVVVIAPHTQPASRPATTATATPWYRRWWVWTIVGVAVAGTAVGLGVGLTRGGGGTEEGYDLSWRYGW